jgi:hypothetical protein
MNKAPYLLLLFFLLFSCSQNAEDQRVAKVETPALPKPFVKDSSTKTIHVFVALCDNRQGIVPVPPLIGNGEDSDNNLYWGTDYGVRTYFKKSKEWTLLKTIKNPKKHILERLIFKHKTQNAYMLADAYNGLNIKETIDDFIQASAGDSLQLIDNQQFGGGSDVVAYIGHNGLMNFSMEKAYPSVSKHKREAIILACISKRYFVPILKTSNAYPMLTTTQLMCPEAYTLHDALAGWLQGESYSKIHERASKAYSFYQKCKLDSAKKLLATGY